MDCSCYSIASVLVLWFIAAVFRESEGAPGQGGATVSQEWGALSQPPPGGAFPLPEEPPLALHSWRLGELNTSTWRCMYHLVLTNTHRINTCTFVFLGGVQK